MLLPPQALSQSWLSEAKSENRLSENQPLASLNFPVFGDLRQSRHGRSAAAHRQRDYHGQGKEFPMRLGNILSIGLLVAACWMVPGVAQARGGMHEDGLPFSRQLLHALQLSDDQKTQVREAYGTYRATVGRVPASCAAP